MSTQLKSKVDYFGLGDSGWEVQSTNENRQTGTAEAQSSDGFVVAIAAFGERLQPQCDYIATADATTGDIVIGSVTEIDGKQIALGSVSIQTKAGEPPTMTATGSQIEDDGTAKCTATMSGLSVDSLFHAQDFGLFTVSNGQLVDSTLTIDGNIGLAEVDGEIKSSDLVGAKITVNGTIIGVTNAGVIATPSVTLKTPSGNVLSGVMTQPLSESNPNGDFPSYSFQAEWGMKADN